MRFAQGKLLITGEYLILDGAKALAFPLKFGQFLESSTGQEGAVLHWQSFEMEELWLDLYIDKATLSLVKTNNEERAVGVLKVLQAVQNLKENALNLPDQMQMKSNFPFISGFGSSATLIALMADHFQVDVFQLSDQTFGGSGYDVACAFHDGPLSYQIQGDHRIIESVVLRPEITQHLFFVHSGQKMNSRNAIAHYKSRTEAQIKAAVAEMSALTDAFIQANSKAALEEICSSSERILKNILQQDTWNDLFPDCPFVLKALGAWGGDYFMAIADNKTEVENYFKQHQLNQILCYQELI